MKTPVSESDSLAALVGRSVDAIDTPALVIDLDAMKRNLARMAEFCRKHHTEVARREEPNLPPLEVDPQLITQALVNLIVNAAEATPSGGGAIEVETARATSLGRDEIAVRVRDSGGGIPAERERQLFKPFFTTKPEGHGLGLAVSQNILLEHGGRIVAANRPDAPGALFELQIPVVR